MHHASRSMLGVVIGRGGLELGATFWGQTELSVYDDSMHGIWGMSVRTVCACCMKHATV